MSWKPTRALCPTCDAIFPVAETTAGALKGRLVLARHVRKSTGKGCIGSGTKVVLLSSDGKS